MAKKTFVVEINSTAKKEAMTALLTALGFKKNGPDTFVEIVEPKPRARAKTAGKTGPAEAKAPGNTKGKRADETR